MLFLPSLPRNNESVTGKPYDVVTRMVLDFDLLASYISELQICVFNLYFELIVFTRFFSPFFKL